MVYHTLFGQPCQYLVPTPVCRAVSPKLDSGPRHHRLQAYIDQIINQPPRHKPQLVSGNAARPRCAVATNGYKNSPSRAGTPRDPTNLGRLKYDRPTGSGLGLNPKLNTFKTSIRIRHSSAYMRWFKTLPMDLVETAAEDSPQITVCHSHALFYRRLHRTQSNFSDQKKITFFQRRFTVKSSLLPS